MLTLLSQFHQVSLQEGALVDQPQLLEEELLHLGKLCLVNLSEERLNANQRLLGFVDLPLGLLAVLDDRLQTDDS